MTLCLDPQATFRVVLKRDAAAGGPQLPPAFSFRYLSYRQWQASEDFLARLRASGFLLDAAAGKEVYELLRRNLVAWEGLPVLYAPEDLEAVTTLSEALELLYDARRQSELSEADLGNSPSPSPGSSPSAEAAPPAAEATAPMGDGAPTSPASGSP